MFRARRWLIAVTILLQASLGGNAVLAWMVREQYRGTVKLRLDPTSEAKFTPLNAELQSAKAGENRVVFAGDSHIELWRNLPVVDGCQMINRGQSRDTSAQLCLRLQRDVIALKPTIVVLEIGATDLRAIGALPDEERIIIDKLKSNRKAIIDGLTAAGIQVIVCTIFPFGDVTLARRLIWSDRTLLARDEVNREIRELERPGVTIFDADPIVAVDSRMKAEYQLDGLHLNEAGYRALNQSLAPVIETIRRK